MDTFGQQYSNVNSDRRAGSDQGSKFNAPFAQTYLQKNYEHFQSANQPQYINLQKNQTVLNQLNTQSFRSTNTTQQSQIDNEGIIYQNHVMRHPQVKEMIHREQAITVVSREDIESVWKNKCNQLQLALTEVQTEVMRIRGIGGMSEKVTYVEDTIKLNQLYLEIDRLNKCLLDLSLDLDTMRSKYLKLEGKNKKNFSDVDVDSMRQIMLENESVLNSEIMRLRSDLDEWQKRYRIIELSLSEHRGQEGTLKDYDQKTSQLRQDIDRLNLALNHKTQECEEFRVKYMKIEVQLRENATLEVELRRIKELLETRNREIEQLRHQQSLSGGKDQQISKLERELQKANDELKFGAKQIQDMKQSSQNDHRLQSMQADNARLSQDIKDREQEIKKMRQQFGQYEDMEKRHNDLQQDHASLQEQINFSRGQEGRLAQLDDDNMKLQSQIRKLNNEIQELKNYIEDQEQQIQESTSSTQQVTILSDEVATWKKKFIDLNRQFHENAEELIMIKAEADSLKSRKVQGNQSTVGSSRQDPGVRQSENRRSEVPTQEQAGGYKPSQYQSSNQQSKPY